MKKQDDMIKQLFDDYASELAPRDELSSVAREEMTTLNEQRKSSVPARKNKGFVRHLGWIIPVSFVLFFVAVFGVFLPVLGLNDNPNSGNDIVQTPSETVYYTFADVKGRSISLDDCDDVLQISRLNSAGYKVLNARYYGFFTEDGELRYIRVTLGVRDADGTFTEIELIAEVDGYVREDLKRTYETYSDYNYLVCDSGYADNGEYVTQAYFASRDMHFYIVVRNGQATNVAREIISTLV